ncbi:MBL fold metallo-hydrolase [Nonomuraea sp. NPDC001636]|uniref:MBL fold metallo-hydrolase n=1 Tax=Nonomuraea sp. NPDC001636 TaxID=3154391 RepID=UPI00332028D1
MHHDGPFDDLGQLHAWLRSSSTQELAGILDEADDAHRRMHAHPPRLGQAPSPVVAGATEVTLLGALGHRYGMLAGGAGGVLIRTGKSCVIVDPGPAALGLLLQLARQGRFDFADVDALLVSHFHPDHYTDVIPCLEGAMSARQRPGRVLLAANSTVIQRFAAFTPFHMRRVDTCTFTHLAGQAEGEQAVKLADLVVHATPAVHHEHGDETRTAIGFALDTPGGGVWYTGDTGLFDGLLDAVVALLPQTALVIAHASGTGRHAVPERAAACDWHLHTDAVPAIAAVLRPACVVVQHYDAAYASARYRIAQAEWLQRQLHAHGHETTVVGGRNGLQLTFDRRRLLRSEIVLDNSCSGPS